MKPTLLQFLEMLNEEHLKLKKEKFPFNERELAKAQLVRSLLKKVKMNVLNP